MVERTKGGACAATWLKIVVSRMSPNVVSEEMAERYIAFIAEEFDGEIAIARDLNRF